MIGAGIAAAGIAGGMYSSSRAGKKAAKASAAATAESARQFNLAMEEARKAASYLESIGVPTEEAQRISLEYAQLDPSALEDIETDPRLRGAQMDALSQLQQMGEAGLTESEKAQQQMITRTSGAQAQARDKAILQEMSERGIGGSGSELIARLQGSQSAADRASVQQAQLAGQTQSRALQAISQAGQLGGQIRGQEYGEQAQAATAADRIAQFNAMQRAQAQQQQEISNKALIQQQFENEMAKRQAVAAARTGTAQMGVQRAGQIQQAGSATAAGHLQQGVAQSQLFGSLAGAGIGAAAKEDGGVVYQDGGMVLPERMQLPEREIPNSNAGFDAGGVMGWNKSGHKFAGGGIPVPEASEELDYQEGVIVPGDNFEGDRVDAKINSGEMVLNLEQQQKLMELLKGYRSLQGLGDEDIISQPGGEAPDLQIPDPRIGEQPNPDISEFPPQGQNPMNPEFEQAQVPQFQDGGYAYDDGGMVPSEYKTPTEAKPRGLHGSLKHEREAEEKANVDSKQRKARIKAYEVLANGGK